MKPLKVGVIILGVLATLVGGCFMANWYGWHRMKTGYEVKAKDYAPYLRAKLEEDLRYSGFEHSWLQKAWVNGFQDHTHLFVVSGNVTGLRAAIEKVTSGAPSQPHIFGSGGYLGPSTAPDWWDTARTDAAESRYYEKDSRFWRFTWLDDRLYIVYLN
jgi:hypothetical protein